MRAGEAVGAGRGGAVGWPPVRTPRRLSGPCPGVGETAVPEGPLRQWRAQPLGSAVPDPRGPQSLRTEFHPLGLARVPALPTRDHPPPRGL